MGAPPSSSAGAARRLMALLAQWRQQGQQPVEDELGGVRVVRGKRAVGEQVLVTWVEEELAAVCFGHELARRIDVAAVLGEPLENVVN